MTLLKVKTRKIVIFVLDKLLQDDLLALSKVMHASCVKFVNDRLRTFEEKGIPALQSLCLPIVYSETNSGNLLPDKIPGLFRKNCLFNYNPFVKLSYSEFNCIPDLFKYQ